MLFHANTACYLFKPFNSVTINLPQEVKLLCYSLNPIILNKDFNFGNWLKACSDSSLLRCFWAPQGVFSGCFPFGPAGMPHVSASVGNLLNVGSLSLMLKEWQVMWLKGTQRAEGDMNKGVQGNGYIRSRSPPLPNGKVSTVIFPLGSSHAEPHGKYTGPHCLSCRR